MNIRREKYGQKLRPRTKHNCEPLYSGVVQRCMWSVQAKDRRIRSRSSWSIVPWLPEIRHEIKFDGMWVVVASLLSRPSYGQRRRRCTQTSSASSSSSSSLTIFSRKSRYRLLQNHWPIVQINSHLRINKKKGVLKIKIKEIGQVYW